MSEAERLIVRLYQKSMTFNACKIDQDRLVMSAVTEPSISTPWEKSK